MDARLRALRESLTQPPVPSSRRGSTASSVSETDFLTAGYVHLPGGGASQGSVSRGPSPTLLQPPRAAPAPLLSSPGGAFLLPLGGGRARASPPRARSAGAGAGVGVGGAPAPRTPPRAAPPPPPPAPSPPAGTAAAATSAAALASLRELFS